MTRRSWLVVPFLCLFAVLPAAAQVLPVTTPEAAGMASERVQRLTAGVREYVDRREISGAIVVLLRGGKVVSMEPVGRMDIEGNRPMRKDAIFRMASMSKAVTSVAAMILMEEGRLRLSDPVSRFLPAFKQTTVAVPGLAGTGRKYGVVPARREITIRDLLTHTAGISYGTGPAAESYKAAGLQGWYLSDKKEPIAPLMERLASLPFDSQPGEQYVYGYNTDILGAVVEKASGLPLDQFFRTRIFEPLKMTDTSFYLPPEKRDRLAVVYSAAEGGVVKAPAGGTGQGDYVDGPRTCFSGGAGLLSTANDYARFLQMLLNGGELEGARILGPKFVELMTTNHVGGLYSEGRLGFGLGFELTEHVGRAARPDSVGTFGWGSAYYSTYWVDPQENLVAILLTQLIPAGGVDLREKFRYLVYQAIVGPLPQAR